MFATLAVVYFLLASVTTFDIRLNQAKRRGELPPDESVLPPWVAGLYWLEWGVLIALLYLNWKLALALWVLKFVLKVVPVLEVVGNVLMSPFKPRPSPPPRFANLPPDEAREAEELSRSLRERLEKASKESP